jgi:DNA-binding NtrC family response regulator
MRLIHMGKSGRQATPEQTGKTLALKEPIRLAVITQNADDAEILRKIAASYGWRISIVASSDAAIALLKEHPTSLVICDRDILGEAWPDVFAKIAALPEAVCILLASRVVDDYLWRQVIRHHGYDFVAKPFRPEDLRRAVTFAWSWRGWTHRHYAEVLRTPTT